MDRHFAWQAWHPVPYVPRLPRKVLIHIAKCDACVSKLYVCKLCVSKLRVSKLRVSKLCVSKSSTTPATWNEGGCHQVPRLPRETKMNVSKCHACHAKSRADHSGTWEPSAPLELAQCHTCHACHAKWVSRVPRLPRETKVDVTKYHKMNVSKRHACHAKSRGDHSGTWEPSAPPEPAQCHTCHACHAKWRSISPSATPAWVSCMCASCAWVSCVWVSCVWASCVWVSRVPRLPRETKVDVTKYHACHVKRRWMSPSATPAMQKAVATTRARGNRELAQCHTCHGCPRKVSKSSTRPATWNEGGCHQVPRLPRETKMSVSKCHACHAKSRGRGDHSGTWEPSVPPEPAQCHTRHACHVKRRWMSQSATPATQSAATCLQVSRLPRNCSYTSPSATPVTQKAAATTRATAENRARHQSQPSAICATPATWNEGGCLKVPRLPRKVQLHVSKCHACHASATPATVCE